MATSLMKPRIALVANSIIFQREENRLISLDTLTMQVNSRLTPFAGGKAQNPDFRVWRISARYDVGFALRI